MAQVVALKTNVFAYLAMVEIDVKHVNTFYQ